jgi:cob(I)alamin adenosyltransferase
MHPHPYLDRERNVLVSSARNFATPNLIRLLMANRLSKITTRTGDEGTTGLGDGARVSKSVPRIAAMGDVDELNSVLGVLVCTIKDNTQASNAFYTQTLKQLSRIQNDLFDLGGEICIPGYQLLHVQQVENLDNWIAGGNAQLPPLKEFILPGGSLAAAQAHVARTVCRRAERACVTLAQSETVPALTLQYLNRLSDLLFVLARNLNVAAGQTDICWERFQAQSTE